MRRLIELWQPLRDYWKTGKAGVTIVLISFYVICYGKIALDHEIANGWNGHKSFQNLLKEISAFAPIAGVLAAMHILEVDIIMFLSDFYKDLREKRDQKVKEKGIAEGMAEERQKWAQFWSSVLGAKTEAEEITSEGAEEITSDEPAPTPPKSPSE